MNEIKINQCLFGYQDGHRLLAASVPLPQDIVSQLNLLSDLAPDLTLPLGEGYWTGVPLPSLKSYALMRTWLAPELPRPGCVWTHILLIPFSEMARFDDMGTLTQLIERPNISVGLDSYFLPRFVTSSLVRMPARQAIFDEHGSIRLIRAIYSKTATGTVIAHFGELDAAIFAIWSQQWPRLRRTFSFRTAARSTQYRVSKSNFDLTILLSSDNKGTISNWPSSDLEEWESAALGDLRNSKSNGLRRFLWRYGADVRLGKSRFRLLAQIYLASRSNFLSGNDLYRLITQTVNAFPSTEEAKMLKCDLVGKNEYSLLPTVDLIDLLTYYIRDSNAGKLPPLSDDSFEAIKKEWDSRSEDILTIAEVAAEQDTVLAASLLERLASVTTASTFLLQTEKKPSLRHKFLSSTPKLLDSESLTKYSGSALLKLVSYIPTNDSELAMRLLPRLLILDESLVADEMMRRFPEVTITVLATKIEEQGLEKKNALPKAWLTTLRSQTEEILAGNLIAKSKSTSALYLFASILGYASENVVRFGPAVWIQGLHNALDNVSGPERQRFLVFLLELALNKPIPGCEKIFEFSFQSVHSDLHRSELDWKLLHELLKFLPTLSWLQNWDNCRRLRAGVARAYVKGNLSVDSFKRLTSDGQTRLELSAELPLLEGGTKYLKRTMMG